MLGDGLALLAVPLLVLQLSRSPLLAVLASLPGSAGYLAAGLPAGVMVDRLNPWHVIIAGDIIRALIFLALFAVTGTGGTSPWLILSLAFVAGVVTVCTETAIAIAVRDVFAGPQLISANSWLEAANQGGLIIGPGAAGLLAAAGLLHVSLLIDAGTFLISLGSLLLVRRHHRADVTGRRPPVSLAALRGELTDGLKYLRATRLLLTLLSFMLVLNLCLGADKLIIFLARSTLHLPAAQVGLVVTAGGVGGLLGAAGTGLLVRRTGPLPANRAERGCLRSCADRDRDCNCHARPAGREPAVYLGDHRSQRDDARASAGPRAARSARSRHGIVARRRPVCDAAWRRARRSGSWIARRKSAASVCDRRNTHPANCRSRLAGGAAAGGCRGRRDRPAWSLKARRRAFEPG